MAKVFQSAPAIAGGRYRGAHAAHPAGATVSIRARHCWRAIPLHVHASGFAWLFPANARTRKIRLRRRCDPSLKGVKNSITTRPYEAREPLGDAGVTRGSRLGPYHARSAIQRGLAIWKAVYSTSGPSKSTALNWPCSTTSKPRVASLCSATERPDHSWWMRLVRMAYSRPFSTPCSLQ